MTDHMTCKKCGVVTESKVVCDDCRPHLNQHEREKFMRGWHAMIVERDGNACVHCGHSASWESGELCGNHKITQGARADLKYDLNNGECVCMICNGKHADRKLPCQTSKQSGELTKARRLFRRRVARRPWL